MMFAVLIQTGCEKNFKILMDSILSTEEGSTMFFGVSADYPCPMKTFDSVWNLRKTWNPSKEWNSLIATVPASLPVVMISDDVRLTRKFSLSILSALAEATNAGVHASIEGNVIGKSALKSPYVSVVPEILRVAKGTDIPLICAAIPSGWITVFDERYTGYGRDDHDFWQQSLAHGRKVYLTRSVIVAHDSDFHGTGRSVSRRKGDFSQVEKNNALFLSKWGYL